MKDEGDDGGKEHDDEDDNDDDDDDDDNDDDNDEEIIIDGKLSVSQLREICRELDLPQSGNKSKLIKRINENK